jgi:hypothetical protein
MLTRLARLLLVATTLAPIAIVYALAVWPSDRVRALCAVGLAFVLLLLCLYLLWYVRRHVQQEQLSIERSKNVDREILAFLITYLIPLITRKDSDGNLAAMLGVILLIAVVIYKADMLHVNPLLGLLGYHFFEIGVASGSTYLLITKKDVEHGARTITALRLGNNVWLEV